MRKIEILVKELAVARLTVTNDRITLKIPSSITPDERQKMEDLVYRLDKEIVQTETTFRGFFKNGEVTLFPRNGNKRESLHYTI